MIFTNQHCSLTYVLWTARGPWRRAATWQWHVQWAGRKIQILIWSEGACWNSRIRAHWNQIHHSRYEFVQLIQCWICLRHALLNPWDGDIWEWKSKWFLAFFAQSQEDDFGALQKKRVWENSISYHAGELLALDMMECWEPLFLWLVCEFCLSKARADTTIHW